MLATEYLRAQRIRARLCRDWDELLAPYDALVGVPTAGPATAIDDSTRGKFRAETAGAPGNVCGTPAIVVPTGLTSDGLPTALQLDGRAWSENRLIAIATAFQNATAWHTLRPKLE
jgi:aspartyl-tRNA(Asn)/glutamyl-tRNA(Gln) amidotransferase subunit A